MDITVYTQPSCGGCIATKKTLERLGVSFTTVDVSKDDAALADIKDRGFMSAPVVVAGDEAWAGFQPERLAALATR